jgi:lambda repressor-like predicted transcriptional regulator
MGNTPSNIIKSKMKLKDIRSKELAKRLKKYGEELTDLSLNNKLKRDSFNATFFFNCMIALEITILREEDWK